MVQRRTLLCGRYTLATTPEMIAHSFDIRLDSFEFLPRYNIAPTQDVLTVISQDGFRQARMMRWGLIPFWAKDAKVGNRMINARAESVADNRAFKSSFQSGGQDGLSLGGIQNIRIDQYSRVTCPL